MNACSTRRLAAMIIVGMAAYPALATDRHVPSEYATIQAAINACVTGDVVIVADGTHTGAGNKDLDFGGRAITVRSANGPTNCIIDCAGSGRGFYFHSGESATSSVQGLTIRNGNSVKGGGVYCSSASPTLTDCTITANIAGWGGGGGVYCDIASPTLTRCAITDNAAGGASGGGVYCCSASRPALANCTIMGNTASDIGGGMYCDQSDPTLTNCTVTGNTAYYGGGGLYCYVSSPMLTNSTISDNTANSSGGGLYCNSSGPVLNHCAITGNRTNSNGGGVHCYFSSPKLSNCTITRNSSESNGGGVYCDSSGPTLTNCTIVDNTASSGGGAYCFSSSGPTVTNCILWANTPEQISVLSGSPVVTYCDVEGAWSGSGNVNAEPGFAFPTDFHLLPDSPCIDAGTNTPPGGLAAHDLDGQPRSIDGDGNGTAVVDMGAYEFNPATPTLAVSGEELVITAQLGQAGSCALEIRNSSLGTLAWALQSEASWLTAEPAAGESAGEVDTVTLTADTTGLAHETYITTLWVNAPHGFNNPRPVTVVLHVTLALRVPDQYATIQAAIDANTVPGDEVVVADGVYTGAGNEDLDFRGRAITVRSASGAPSMCIIDCEGSGRGFYFHSRERAASIVQGLTIRNGNALDGGGVYCDYSSPTLTNCTIAGNTASRGGGGVYCHTCRPTLTNCAITGNTASDRGGGVYCYSSASPTLTDCTITDNTAGYGGALSSYSSASPALTDCTITGNTAGYGGGVHCEAYGSPTLTHCTITGNMAQGQGGAVYCYQSSPWLTNCTITENRAVSGGGGVHCHYSNPTLTNCTINANRTEIDTSGGGVYCYSSSPTLTNCTIMDNTALGSGGGVTFDSSSGSMLINCTITGNTATRCGGGLACTGSSPTLTNCRITGNTASTGGGVYVSSSTLTLTSCTITGNTAAGNGGGVYCSSSSPTLTNCTIAGNTADSGGGVYCYSTSSGATLANCILWANTPEQIFVSSGSPVVTYCNVEGVWSGPGNINADPRFAFPTDFHLLPDSPCIDAGTNSPPGGLAAHDLDGQPRPLDGDGNGTAVADMGAHEFNSTTPTLALSAEELVITARLGETGSQALGIRNGSLGTLAWALQWEADWLTTEPMAGESAGEVDSVMLTADTANLAHGTYVTTLWVNAPQAFNAPRAVTIVLHVPSVLNVPGQYATIQAAIDAATEPGDEVVIADGVYKGAGNKDLDFLGQPITVRSASKDPNTCVIDCEGSGRGFAFHRGESAASLVQGLTIRNGNTTLNGGGVSCHSSSPTLMNCTITGNTANGAGGGGGVSCESSSPTLTNCTITGNYAGIGGGVTCASSSPTLTQCTITGNTATYGGGMYCLFSSPWLTNCTITTNDAVTNGGGVYCNYGRPTLTNCTITGNGAGSTGGAVYCYSTSRPELTNCILWANTPEQIFVYPDSSAIVTYCDVQGAWSGAGNINAEPRFASPTDFHLLPDSPCIDAGDNDALPPNVTTDLDGNSRFVDDPYTPDTGHGVAPIVDIGAYERMPPGDVTCDGVVNFADINPFVLALTGQAPYESAFPNCPWLNADVNGDGLVNFADINPFVRLLTDD